MDWIQSALGEGVTAQDSPGTEENTPKNAPNTHGINEIGGTGGVDTTVAAEDRPQNDLIEAYHEDQKLTENPGYHDRPASITR
jgi:hypothetical protein